MKNATDEMRFEGTPENTGAKQCDAEKRLHKLLVVEVDNYREGAINSQHATSSKAGHPRPSASRHSKEADMHTRRNYCRTAKAINMACAVSFLCGLAFFAACGGEETPTPAPSNTIATDTAQNPTQNPPDAVASDSGQNGPATVTENTVRARMLYDGSIYLKSSAEAKAMAYAPYLRGVDALQTGILISAPIFPGVGTLYSYEGENYPSDQEGLLELARAGHYSFEFLRDECAAKPVYKDRIKADDGALTEIEIFNNYDAVSQCSYEYFLSKPYFIPQLVKDVDICEAKLGTDFRMLTETDVRGLSEDISEGVHGILASVAPESSWGLAPLYFSLWTYIKGADGSLKTADLSPGVQNRIFDFTGVSKFHYEGNIVLRCYSEDVLMIQ